MPPGGGRLEGFLIGDFGFLSGIHYNGLFKGFFFGLDTKQFRKGSTQW